MVIGRLQPGQAKNTDLKGAIAIGLDEALTALEESFFDLTDEQVSKRAFPGRHNITTIVMHLLENLDTYACKFQAGRLTLEHEERFDVWQFSPDDLQDAQDGLPSVATMLARLRSLRAASTAALESATEDDLRGPRCAEDRWTDQQGRTSADAYMRTIWHTMAHVRQIWLMRGAMGLTDQDGWPEQHWA